MELSHSDSIGVQGNFQNMTTAKQERCKKCVIYDKFFICRFENDEKCKDFSPVVRTGKHADQVHRKAQI